MTTSMTSSSPKKSDGKKVKIATSDGRQVLKHWVCSTQIEFAILIFIVIANNQFLLILYLFMKRRICL
jgi:hypothetical protein